MVTEEVSRSEREPHNSQLLFLSAVNVLLLVSKLTFSKILTETQRQPRYQMQDLTTNIAVWYTLRILLLVRILLIIRVVYR